MTIDIPTRRALAEKCGIGDDYLYQVLTGRKVGSPELCFSLEKQSEGALTRQQLRPTDFWKIWPDLAHLAPSAIEAA